MPDMTQFSPSHARKLAVRCFRRSPEDGGCVAVYVVTQGNRSPIFQRAFLNMVAASAASLRRFLPEARITVLLMTGLAVQVPRELAALVNETRTIELDPVAGQMSCRYQGWLEKPLVLARCPYDKAVFFDADVLIEHADVAHLFASLEADQHDFMAVPPSPLCTRSARARHALRTRSALVLHAPCTRSASPSTPLVHALQVREVNTSRSRRGASESAHPLALPPALPRALPPAFPHRSPSEQSPRVGSAPTPHPLRTHSAPTPHPLRTHSAPTPRPLRSAGRPAHPQQWHDCLPQDCSSDPAAPHVGGPLAPGARPSSSPNTDRHPDRHP